MTETFNRKLNRKVSTIFPGEYHVLSSSGVISTLLGSCVAVVLYDPIVKVGGMNHFMLPEAVNTETFYLSSAGKYGMYAMELLINGLVKIGANKVNLKAKVFGGSSMFGDAKHAEGTIPASNTQLAFRYLACEHIPVEASDVGGDQARRLYFFNDTFKVYVKKIQKSHIGTIEHKEKSYLEQLKGEALKRANRVVIYRGV